MGRPMRIDLTRRSTARLVAADGEVDDGDVGAAPIDGGEETQRVDGECGLETLEAEQHAECFASGGIGVDDVHQTVAIEECVVVDVF